jgi:type I protein arginine methyltransferase
MITESENSAVLGQFIPLHYHFNMLGDRARMKAFKEALQAVVPKGGKVVELGGGTGVLSFFAAERASKVWCVERDSLLVASAKEYLALNSVKDRVEVIEGDAMTFLPPEPVDVVVCEMLHVALLREKQVQIIQSFKKRYREKFGPKLPLFVPEASIMAVQPVNQNFNFSGYYAPVPLFSDPMIPQEETKGLGEPLNYLSAGKTTNEPSLLVYNQDFSDEYSCDGKVAISTSGTLNALRFITKNALAVIVSEKRTIDWFNQYMVIPLKTPIEVKAGESVKIKFAYRAGDSIQALTKSIQVTKA